MEDIQRDLAKEIAALQPSTPTRKNRRWTLLFVGDHGKVVTIRWFRWIVMLWAFLLVLAAVVSGTFYYLYRHTLNVNAGLRQSLDKVQQQVAELRNDKEVLMTRLVVAETKMERLRPAVGPKPEEKAPEDGQEVLAKKEPLSNSQVAQQTEAAVSAPGEKLISNPAPVEQENGSKVSIEELKVSYETAGHVYRAQFIVRNTGPESSPVSGYTAIILKKPDTRPEEWLTLPTLKLAEGVPTGDKRGQYFSIFRFKTVRFMVKSQMDPQQFDTATVYVFGENKDLLFEKNIPINIQETAFNPSP